MTRQTWTAFVSAIFFVGLAAFLALVPVPYVTWSPGGTQNTLGNVGSEPIIKVSGIETFPTTGELDLTTVGVTRADSSLGLPEAIAAYWLPHRDALPRESIYAPGKSVDQVNREEADMMETAQDDAVVAALRAAGEPVTEMPVVSSVIVGGPAHNILLPGDLIVSVDGVPVSHVEDVGTRIRTHAVGDSVTFDILRNHRPVQVKVVTASSATQSGVPVVGIEVAVGYKYSPEISFDLGQELGGPSAGLVFGLAIYDKITAGPLLAGRHIAGTGTITPNGDVGAIGGIQEKIAGADKDGATVFLVPAPNCKDLAGVRTSMTLIKVATLGGAIAAMKTLSEPGGSARTARCP
jgi:Lon-like protease